MHRSTRQILIAVTVSAGLLLAACGGDDTAVPEQSEPPSSAPTEPTTSAAATPAPSAPAVTSSSAATQTVEPVAGSYISYDDYQADRVSYSGGDVVLFFNASWCPTCQEAERNLNAGGVPDGLTVVKVDYDSARDLRRTYGVTIQHTFVQVDPSGEALKKWTGSADGAEISSQTV